MKPIKGEQIYDWECVITGKVAFNERSVKKSSGSTFLPGLDLCDLL